MRPCFLKTFFLVALLLPMAGHASFWDKLITPGKLSTAHQEFDDDCNSCHLKEKKANQLRLCVDCHDHKDIADDRKNKRGLHGKEAAMRAKECKECHTEHIGRSGDIVGIDQGGFSHKNTDFELKGAHKKVQCSSCHKATEKYSAAKSTCYACHKQDDVHREKLGKKCHECHSEKSWKKSKFDHDEETDFPLVGEHKKIDCDLCHVSANYEKTPTKCVACHKVNDIHNNEYGDKCKRCHTPVRWTKTKFKHDKKTYHLSGVHDSTPCLSCHKNSGFDDKVSNKCISCHKTDDVHKTRFGQKCGRCHGQKDWSKYTFKHTQKKTKFALKGEHKKVECLACHRGVIKKQRTVRSCFSCHKQDDVHNSQEGKQCQQCHSEQGWAKKVELDHGQTRFPLMGQHSILGCESCHEDTRFKDLSIKCVSCHEDDDVHKKSMGNKCSSCHTPNDWRIWKFDHNKNTGFKIDGKHEKLKCNACHVSNTHFSMNISKMCRSCHRSDDVHSGSFGRRCEKCHTTKSFSDIKQMR